MARPISIPYKVLTSLLFAEFDYLERELPLIVIPITPFGRQLKLRPRIIKEALEHLEAAGLIEEYTWHRHHANVRLCAPIGMAILKGGASELEI